MATKPPTSHVLSPMGGPIALGTNELRIHPSGEPWPPWIPHGAPQSRPTGAAGPCWAAAPAHRSLAHGWMIDLLFKGETHSPLLSNQWEVGH